MLKFPVLFPCNVYKLWISLPTSLPAWGPTWHLVKQFLAVAHTHFHTFSGPIHYTLLYFTRIRSFPIVCGVHSLLCAVIFMGGKLGHDDKFLVCDCKAALRQSVNDRDQGMTEQKGRHWVFSWDTNASVPSIKGSINLGLFNVRTVCSGSGGLEPRSRAHTLPTSSHGQCGKAA